eukprot:174223_1
MRTYLQPNSCLIMVTLHSNETELSIEGVVSFAMQAMTTLRYSYWRRNGLGFGQFDERNPSKMTLKTNDHDYFDQLSFDWDDSRHRVSFSKQTTPAAKREKLSKWKTQSNVFLFKLVFLCVICIGYFYCFLVSFNKPQIVEIFEFSILKNQNFGMLFKKK